MPDWDILDMDPLLDSSNMTVTEWNEIGRIISEHYDRYDGFVILHGTDTMAYTSSALSFMLRNNRKPVILTGSQIPLCELRNDARDNLITALMMALLIRRIIRPLRRLGSRSGIIRNYCCHPARDSFPFSS